jgi:acyl homoserine lactone synthase
MFIGISMHTSFGTARELPPDLKTAMAKFRHAVFVDRLKWDIPAKDGLELDQFDRDDTVYVVIHDPVTTEVAGCARLLPTTHPYLLSSVFPQLMNGAESPSRPDVWELSRFAVSPQQKTTQFSYSHPRKVRANQLMAAVVSNAHSQGASQLIMVSSLAGERIVQQMGVVARRTGPPVVSGGEPIVAFWIDIDQANCRALGLSFVPEPVTLN